MDLKLKIYKHVQRTCESSKSATHKKNSHKRNETPISSKCWMKIMLFWKKRLKFIQRHGKFWGEDTTFPLQNVGLKSFCLKKRLETTQINHSWIGYITYHAWRSSHGCLMGDLSIPSRLKPSTFHIITPKARHEAVDARLSQQADDELPGFRQAEKIRDLLLL